MSELFDFLYLDIVKLHSFVSQIQGGMISEISETIKQIGGLSAGINVGIPPLGGKVDTSKQKESERQQNVTLTDPAYFKVLYQYLKQEKKLFNISNLPNEKISELQTGQFIELKGFIEPPLVEDWIERLNMIFSFIENNFKTFGKLQGNSKGKQTSNFSNMELRQFRSIIDLLIDFINLTRKDIGKQYVRLSLKNQNFKIWCGLLPDYVLIPLRSISPVEVHLFGRFDHAIEKGKNEKIVDLSLFNQASQINNLLDVLNNFNIIIGQKPISESDLEATYQDIFIVPVAIYQ